ncbi:MAG: hypothetical protein ACXWKC_14390 [Xanthobacteraceae bacterium]
MTLAVITTKKANDTVPISHIADKWAFAVPYLEMSFGDRVLATGSSFFWRAAERIYLVSNWHNFSERDPQNGQPISDTGGVPNHITLLCFKKDGEADSNGLFSMSIIPVKVPLYDEDVSVPRWVEHPILGRKADVAAIDVSDAVADLVTNTVNEIEADAVLDSFPSQDVFIVGYPLGLIPKLPAPVWKRGTLATDPNFDPDNLPKMFVDALADEVCPVRW